jgi:hypothetical protein
MEDFLKFSLAALLIGALAGEWKATTDVMAHSKAAIRRCTDPSTTQCDLVGSASNLAAYTQDQGSILWRRGIIAACALCVTVQPLADLRFTSKQALIFVLLTWVVFTSITSYNDFHLRRVSAIGVQDCLLLAVNNAEDACDASLVNSVAMERSIRKVPKSVI